MDNSIDIEAGDMTMTGESDHVRDEDFGPLVDPGCESAEPEVYPRLWNMSAGHLVRGVIRAEDPLRPEYVAVPLRPGLWDEASLKLSLAITKWNLLWEASQFRRRFFDDEELPAPLYKIADQGDVNVIFVPRTESRYHEYAPLFHLLSRTAAQRHGLPLLKRGQWPFVAQLEDIDGYLPSDFRDRLARAWAGTVWRHLMPQPQSGIAKFTEDDPIRMLAHNLDFWLPPVTQVLEDYLREFPVVDNDIAPGPVSLEDGSILRGATIANPRTGGDLWRGEQEAAEAVRRSVEAADATGRLRGILDAVRSHRCEDDFSPLWSGAREDFERKLYHKRAKLRVRFVELTDTIPVHGPEAEVVDQLLIGDFLALLDTRDRTIVVLLRSGVTKLTEVADIMGYQSHSAVSKRMDHILRRAIRFARTLDS
ncbi:sigma-70 family RNA polymerase sigma factor [Micromonospora sp. DH14]|uniref:sigma-70 family RNA polymerase sigma factor n=1 Tax=Micromonospora sp. DH14 TaxID=3040120 RepID=UPI00244210C2|nr:sigma-70 family RNA polymerase sigma factor [Micromonospora sp. DH14]MDG9674816.1 sigma-70 family RNA polymerase sigma factor [Micromonospora sp. DH14]